MLIREILDLAKQSGHNRPMIYYHVTPHTRIPQILQQGLTLGHKRQWSNTFGSKLGATQRIYLFNNLDAAIQMASRLEWGLISQNKRNTQVDILEIHAEPSVEPDTNIEAQFQPGTWWWTTQPIPPDAIKNVIPLTLEMKRDFIARRDGRIPTPK